jgi:hypothetical protein
MGDDANHLSPGCLRRSGNRPHQPNTTPAINQAKPARGDFAAKR